MRKLATFFVITIVSSSFAMAQLIPPSPNIIPKPEDLTPSGAPIHPSQQGFDEQLGIILTTPIICDDDVTIPAGTVVNSHMIFLNPEGGSASGVETWCFATKILGVMSDEYGILESTTSDILGAVATYPGSMLYRGLEESFGDYYIDDYNSLDLNMVVEGYSDFIRVITIADSIDTVGVTFSLSSGSDSVGEPDFRNDKIIGSDDILTVGGGSEIRSPHGPASSAPAPEILVDDWELRFTAPTSGSIEIDALSFGTDKGDIFVFSVDKTAVGCGPGAPITRCATPSDVYEHGYCSCFRTDDGCVAPTVCEAAADVFKYISTGGNSIQYDESDDLGLIAGTPPDISGDDIDALDVNTKTSDIARRIFFSLDRNTAIDNGYSGATILVKEPCETGIRVYATPRQLNLEPGDDIDALALLDNGDGKFNPKMDQVFFSLRRGSPTLEQRECNPVSSTRVITESDILTPGHDCCSGFVCNPRIEVSGPQLGLFINPPDELNALDRIIR